MLCGFITKRTAYAFAPVVDAYDDDDDAPATMTNAANPTAQANEPPNTTGNSLPT